MDRPRFVGASAWQLLIRERDAYRLAINEAAEATLGTDPRVMAGWQDNLRFIEDVIRLICEDNGATIPN